MPPFAKGNIANPKGRPIAARSMADSLRAAMKEKVKVGKRYETREVVLSRMIAEALVSFEAVSPDGKVLKLNPKLWVDMNKFIHNHLDGPAPSQLDITSGGQPLKAYIGYSPDDWDEVIEGEVIEDSPKQLDSGL